MRFITLFLTTAITLMPLTACAYDGKKPMTDQDALPAHLKTGQQIRIGNNHYMILDQVKAYDTQNAANPRARQNRSAELARKGDFSIQAQSAADNGRPVVWNQSTQRFAVLLDELGLVLNDNSTAEAIARQYDMTLTLQIERLKRAYYRVDANKIPDLMRRLQQDDRVQDVLPSLLDQTRQPQ